MQEIVYFTNNKRTKQMKVTFNEPPNGYRLSTINDMNLDINEINKLRLNKFVSSCSYDHCICCDKDEIEMIIERKIYPCLSCSCCGFIMPSNQHKRIYVNDIDGSVMIDVGKIERIK
jgi:hypothetical protein